MTLGSNLGKREKLIHKNKTIILKKKYSSIIYEGDIRIEGGHKPRKRSKEDSRGKRGENRTSMKPRKDLETFIRKDFQSTIPFENYKL